MDGPYLKSRDDDSTARNIRTSAAMANHNCVDFESRLFFTADSSYCTQVQQIVN